MNRQNKVFLAAVSLAFLFSVGKINAVTRCETQYGGGETCREVDTLILDKKIQDPRNGNFQDHLEDVTADGFRFSVDDTITFKIRVKNETGHKIDEVNVVDTFPEFDTSKGKNIHLTLQSGLLSFKIYDLDPGETEQRTIVAHIATDSAIQQNFECTENAVEAWGGGEYHRDTAKFCVNKYPKILGVKTLPKTGAETLVFAVILSLFSAFVGLILIRLNRKP